MVTGCGDGGLHTRHDQLFQSPGSSSQCLGELHSQKREREWERESVCVGGREDLKH